VCTGVSLLLPGVDEYVAQSTLVARLFNGVSSLQPVVVSHAAPNDAASSSSSLPVSIAGTLSATLLAQGLRLHGVPPAVTKCLDSADQAALLCGMEAAVHAGLIAGPRGGIATAAAAATAAEFEWPAAEPPPRLADRDQASTGVILATSFPSLEGAMDASATHDRVWLFRQLVQANAQLAQLLHARGPNLQVSASCTSTSLAVAVAYDWIRVGRCDRVIIIAADNVTAPSTLRAVSEGFASCGVTSPMADPSEVAQQPFGVHRAGMVLGAGAVGLVLESALACEARRGTPHARLLGVHACNSAFHGCRMDVAHLAAELDKFLTAMAQEHDLPARKEWCRELIYFAHETGTKGANGCAQSEMDMLERVFGEDSKAHVLVTATKWMTGHAMGVSFEEVLAVLSLCEGRVPPIQTLVEDRDPALGAFQVSRGGSHPRSYVLHMSAGFGSQVAFVLYGKA